MEREQHLELQSQKLLRAMKELRSFGHIVAQLPIWTGPIQSETPYMASQN
jgi:hypothetical protein